MFHDGSCYILHETCFGGAYPITRLVIAHCIYTYTMTCSCDDGYSTVKSDTRFTFHIVSIGKTRVQSTVRDDHALGFVVLSIMLLGAICRGEGVVAHSIKTVQDCVAQPYFIFWALCFGSEERYCLGCFGE